MDNEETTEGSIPREETPSHEQRMLAFKTAMYYVVSTDTFMSGWGHAKDRVNKVVLPCTSMTEATIVANNARGRSDQKNVRIIENIPRGTWINAFGKQLHDIGELSIHDRYDYSSWYEPGRWSKE